MSIFVGDSLRVTSALPADAKSIWPSTASLYLSPVCSTGFISSSWRYEGMRVYCLDDQGTYKLIGGTADENWQLIAVGSSASFALNTLSASRAQFADTASLALSVAPNIELISGSWRNAANTQRITLSDANGMSVEWSETGTYTPVLKVNTDAISIPAFAGSGNRGLYVDNAGAIRTDDSIPITASIAVFATNAATASMLSDPIVFSHNADETYNVTTQNLNGGLDSKAVVLVQVPTVTGSIKAVVSLGADQSINSLVIDTTTKTLFAVNENGVAEINSTGIDPYTNGLNNLGTNIMRWGTVYANIFDGTASLAKTASYWDSSSIVSAINAKQDALTNQLYVITASLATSASYYPPTVASASWVSASAFIITAQTASYVSASNVLGRVAYATFAISASYASRSLSASFAPVQPAYSSSVASSKQNTLRNILYVLTASLATSASYVAAGNVKGVVSHAISASFASSSLSASYWNSSSIVTLIGTKQDTLTNTLYVLTASLAVSASYYPSQILNTTAAALGTSSLVDIAVATYGCCFFGYFVKGGTNQRAGQLISQWSASSATYNEYTTTDIGDTSGLVFNVILTGSVARIQAENASATAYTIKAHAVNM